LNIIGDTYANYPQILSIAFCILFNLSTSSILYFLPFLSSSVGALRKHEGNSIIEETTIRVANLVVDGVLFSSADTSTSFGVLAVALPIENCTESPRPSPSSTIENLGDNKGKTRAVGRGRPIDKYDQKATLLSAPQNSLPHIY
jgi:hypothetical protein